MKWMESEQLECKERYTDTMAREIVSFLNASGGTIVIGVKDDGTLVGVDKVDETLRKLSDVITMQIEPNPQDEIRTELKFEDGKTLILIHIDKGNKNIYCQKRYGFSSTGCSIRVGTTCREMTSEQIKIRYERNYFDTEYILKKRSSLADLSFRELKIYYADKGFHLDDVSFETNLNLRNPQGEYNLLAELLADRNYIPLIFVKFRGNDKSSISERNDYGCGCLITTYHKIKTRLMAENICLSDTTVRPRKDRYLFDFDCVNEAVLNALVHNDWTITEPQISMFSDRIEILSHGGLMNGMTKQQFFEGISKPRNATLMRIFMNVDLVEHTGHGVPTIVHRYGKNVFEIEDDYIRCTIPFDREVLEATKKPVVSKNVVDQVGLNKTEHVLAALLITHPTMKTSDIAKQIGVSVRTAERTLSSLENKGVILRTGTKKSAKWEVIR